MYRLVAKETARKIDFWRNGVRMRMPGVLLADGSFIKLLPNRPVDISDASMDLNKPLLQNPYINCKRLSVDTVKELVPVEDVKESVLVIEESITADPIVPKNDDLVSNMIDETTESGCAQDSPDDFISPDPETTTTTQKRRRRK